MTTAIITKYLGPTNYHGGRVSASTMDTLSTGHAARKTMNWEHGADAITNHRLAAYDLAVSLKWSGVWVEGSAVTGYVFIRLPYGEAVNDPKNSAFVVPMFSDQ